MGLGNRLSTYWRTTWSNKWRYSQHTSFISCVPIVSPGLRLKRRVWRADASALPNRTGVPWAARPINVTTMGLGHYLVRIGLWRHRVAICLSFRDRAWSTSLRDVVKSIGDADSTRTGWMQSQVQVSKYAHSFITHVDCWRVRQARKAKICTHLLQGLVRIWSFRPFDACHK